MNTYSADVLADSISPCGMRLTTLLVTMPRFILAEFNTHRVFSRNSASSRAIPVEKRIAEVRTDPFVPEAFGRNQRGMQAGEALDDFNQNEARRDWLQAANFACDCAEMLASRGVHKQHANRLIEPYSWHKVIVSATEWSNFYHQRIHPDAQPEMRRTAEAMKAAMDASTPNIKPVGSWHLPLVFSDDWDYASIDHGNDVDDATLVKLSVARCARVSYLTHDGKRDVAADLALYDKLLTGGHMSPFEHAAVVGQRFSSVGVVEHDGSGYSTDFIGNYAAPWVQHRKMLSNEHDRMGAVGGA